MSLTDANKKMSKSEPNESSKISLFDPPDVIARKLKRAKTDSISGVSFDIEKRPEVSNLVGIFSELSGKSVPEICLEFEKSDLLQFKTALIEVVVTYFKPIYQSIKKYQEDEAYLNDVLLKGSQRANDTARQNMQTIYNLMYSLK